MFPSRSLTVRWNDERDITTLEVQGSTGAITTRKHIGYETDLPGTRVTYIDDHQTGSEISSRLDTTIVADETSSKRVLIESFLQSRVGAIQSDRAIQGQIDDNGGYAEVREYSNLDDAIRTLEIKRDSFDKDGNLLAGESCKSSISPNTCNTGEAFSSYGPTGVTLQASPLYFEPGTIEILESQQDAYRRKPQGLPVAVEEFVVLSADPAITLAERDVLCSGIQFTPSDIQLYCTAPDSQLDNVVVAAVSKEAPAGRTLLPGATLVVQ